VATSPLYQAERKMSSSPFKNQAAIQILIIRDSNNNDSDDRIAIKYDHDDQQYVVFYLDANTKSKTIQTITMDGDTLDQYLNSLFTLLALDDKPYENVQFNIPGLPTVIYKATDLSKKKLVEALMTVMPITNGNTY
jgi:hypothetical protein